MPHPGTTKPRRAVYYDESQKLRDIKSAALGASLSEVAVEIDASSFNQASVEVIYSAIGGTVDASNYWRVDISVSNATDGTFTVAATTGPLKSEGGVAAVPISSELIKYKNENAKYIKVEAVEIGSPGNLTYGAYISPPTGEITVASSFTVLGDWHVASVSINPNASDSNNGKTLENPFATIAKLNSVIENGQSAILEDDSFWREEIQIQSLANNTIRRSGTGSERPILDASDVATGWGPSSGQSNTYELAWTPESGNGVTDARITAYEDGDLLIYRDTIAEVESNPGSYTVDGFADTAGNIVYIHPSDSGDPNNNGSTYEVTKRRNCIWCGPGTTVDGVHLRRNINNNGSFNGNLDTVLRNSIVEQGTKHNVYNAFTIENCIIRHNDDRATSSASLVVWNKADLTGVECRLTGSTLIGGNPEDSAHPTTTTGFTAHGQEYAGVENNLADFVRVENTSFDKLVKTGSSQSLLQEFKGCSIKVSALTFSTNRTVFENNFIEHPTIDGLQNRAFINEGSVVEMRGNRIYVEGNAIQYIVFDGPGSLELSNNSILFDSDSDSSQFIQAGGSLSDEISVTVENNIIAGFRNPLNLRGGVVTLSAEDNIYTGLAGSDPDFSLGSDTYTTLAGWQSNPGGYDQNSIYTAPGFASPETGDFTTTAPEVAALQAGVEYYISP